MSKEYIMLGDGKKISYKVYGEGKKTLLFYHGLVGGAYISDEWKESIARKDMSLIAIERSGYGNSSKIEMLNVAEWMPIAEKISQELKLSEVDVIGCSAGAPYAYATAYALGDIVKNVYILGGVPMVYKDSVLRHYTPNNQKQYKMFINQTMDEIQEYYIKQLNSYKQYLEKNGDYVKKTVEENLMNDCFGMAQESKLQIQDWKIPVSEIQQPVLLYHAVADEMVPYKAAKEMTNYLENCSFEEIDICGDNVHISSIFKAFFNILSKVDQVND